MAATASDIPKRPHEASNAHAFAPAISIVAGSPVRATSAATPLGVSLEDALLGAQIAGVSFVIDRADAHDDAGDKATRDAMKLAIDACRDAWLVGRHVEDPDNALALLDVGAAGVVSRFDADPETIDSIPKERIAIRIDFDENRTAVPSGLSVEAAIEKALEKGGSILAVSAERVGKMSGIDKELVTEAGRVCGAKKAALFVMGGIATAADVAFVDACGGTAVAGTALDDKKLDLGDAITAPIRSDRSDGLFATLVVDESLLTLGMCFSNSESIRVAVERKRGVYWSRQRGLWVKGESSGAGQALLRIDMDCDRDAMRFVVRQEGAGFCHVDRRSCFGDDDGSVGALMRTLASRFVSAPVGSYSKRLFDDSKLLASKLHEEADELLEAENRRHAAEEAADVIFFALTAAARHGVTFDDVEAALARRTRRVRRRKGDAKPGREGATTAAKLEEAKQKAASSADGAGAK